MCPRCACAQARGEAGLACEPNLFGAIYVCTRAHGCLCVCVRCVPGVLARKLGVKLAQRVGLTFLEPRMAPWRYVREDVGADIQERLGAGAEGAAGQRQAGEGGEV